MASERKFFVGGNWKMNGNKKEIDVIIDFLTTGPLSANTGKFPWSFTYALGHIQTSLS